MKKVLLLLAIMVTLCTYGWAQLGVGQQMQNNNFENWYTEYSSRIAPTGWHSLNSASGSSLLITFAREDFVSRQSGNPGGGNDSYFVRVTCKTVSGVAANGSLTSGRFNVGSMSASNASNCTYTSTNSNYQQALTAYPDSVYIWARTSIANNKNARINIVIHDNTPAGNTGAIYQDPAPGSAGSNSTGGVVNTTYATNEGKVVAKATWVGHNNNWTHLGLEFNYEDYASNNVTPSYILATLASNNAAGEGQAGDYLDFDDIVLVYNTRLNSLSVNGTPLSGFNPDVTSYNYPTPICESNLPTISGTCASAHASAEITHYPTLAQPYATIRVKHLNQENTVYKDYTINFNIFPNPTVTLNDGGTYSACEGETITVIASGDNITSYAWSNGLGNTATVHPTVSGQYTVTGTDGNGCSGTKTAYVTVNPLPNVTINGSTNATASVCSGTNATLDGGGANSYAWSLNGNDLSSNTSISVNQAGVYTLIGTNTQTGCSNTATATVSVHSSPIVTIDGPTSLCSGTIATMTASGLINYTWSNGLGNNATVNIPTDNPGSTTYTVSGTDANGCTGTSSISVTVKQTPTVSINGPSSICNNTTGSLSVTINPSSTPITWAGGGNNNPLTINSAGTYTVTADLDGCTATTSIFVAPAPVPAEPAVTSGSRCGSGSVTLSAQGEEGTTLNWYANDIATSSSIATGNPYNTPNLSAPTTTYYVSAQYEGGCSSARVPVTATILDKPAAPTVTNVSNCGEIDITLTATNVGSNTLKWYSDAEGNNEITNTNQHVTDTTTFYAATIAANGCRSDLQALTVTIKPVPEEPVVVSPDPYCSNGNVSVTFSATVPSGHIAKWYDENHNFIFQGTQTQSVGASNTYYVTSYSNNIQCESAPVAFNVVINPIPNVPTLSCTPICGEGVTTLNATVNNGLTVKWFTASDSYITSGSTYSADISTSTLFKATAYDESTGCESQAASVTAVVNPTYSITDPQTACDSYTWEGTTYTQSGDYTKNLQSENGCDSTVTLQLTIINGYNQTFDTIVCDQFVWGNDIYTTSGPISKTLTSHDGCDSTVTYNITVKHSSTFSQTLTLCSNQLPYLYSGTPITSAGVKTITLSNAEGCDSTITLYVVVNTQPGTPTITSTTLSRCGSGPITLNVAKGSNSDGCRWYTSDTAEEPFMTGNTYQPNLTETTTYYVSSYSNSGCESPRIEVTATINPIPANPQITTIDSTRCGAGTVVLSASYGENATQCRWYTNNNPNNTTVESNENTYTVNFNSNQNTTRTYYVESYNASTGCKSTTRVAAKAIEYAIPAAPQATATTHCGPLTTDLAEFVTPDNTLYRWYDQSTTLLVENEHYTTTVGESTLFQVSVFNDQTGCESQKTPLNITIYPVYEPQSIYDTVCQYSHYQNHGIDQQFSTPGSFDFEINQLSSTQCDSLVTLYIYVKPQITNTIEKDTCDSFVWNGTTYNESGSYDQTFQAADGCDSVVTLSLTIHNSISTEFSISTCNSYTWNSETYSTSGDYTQNFSTVNGCDSIVTLHLTIFPVYNQQIDVSACQEYVWNDIPYSESGDYTQNLLSVNNCDSIVTMHLTIYQPVVVVLDDYTCVGSNYTENGFDTTCFETGTYTLTHYGQNIHECDSTTILNLTVFPVYETNLYDTICFNETLNFNGQLLNETGTYTAQLATVNECDSTVIMHLYVYPERRDTLTAHICAGASYTENGFNIIMPEETNYYPLISEDIHHCDSTTILHLFVHQPDNTPLETTLCLGEQYNDYGFDVTASEVGVHEYTQSLQNIYGCDSTVTLTVTVNPTHNILLYDSICAGSEYENYGFDTIFTQAGTYPLTNFAPNQFGCDSTTTLMLTVNPVYQHNIQKMICGNSSYVFNGQTLTEAGVYSADLTTIHGCDSLVTLTLTIGTEYRDTVTAHICAGQSYHNYGFDIDTPTETLYDSLQLTAVNQCDSISVLHLFVHYPGTSDIYATICQGESYRQHGFNVTANEPGEFIHNRQTTTQYGCDSTIVLHLTVNPTSSVTLYDTVCAESDFTNYGFDTLFTVAGNYTLVNYGQNTYNCDSVTTLLLTVLPTHHIELTQIVCDSLVWNGTTYFESGDYTQSFRNIYNCDSIVTTHLIVRHSSTHEFSEQQCVSYTWNNETYTESGDYTQIFTNAEGCDSTVTLHLTIYPANIFEFADTSCVSYQWNDSTYSQSGDYVQHFENVNGCDSTVTLHLTIHPAETYTFDESACVSYQWNDSTYYESGEYIQHFETIHGCDSTVTLHLSILPYFSHEFKVTACDLYQWNDSIYTTSGDYVQQLVSSSGCDSTVTLHLTINNSVTGEFADTACASYAWNDSIYVASGDYTQHFTAANGCDSTVTLHLTIYPAETTDFEETACSSFLWNDSLYTTSGDYVQHFQTIHGCDSTVTLHLTIRPAYTHEFAETACTSYLWNDSLYTASGDYIQHFQTIHGCDSTVMLHLTILPTYSIDTTVNICDVDLPFVWNNSEYFDNGGLHILQYTSVGGCDSIIRLTLNVHPTFSGDTNVTVCQGALPYYFDADHSFSQGGVYNINLLTGNGCDSIFHLHLTVTPNAEHTASQTICDSQLPFSFMGQLFDAAGSYDITESDSGNCLTVTHFTLNVNPTFHHFDTVTVCQETLPYLYGSTPLSESGSYDIHFNSALSCDSLVTVLFNVIPTAEGADELFVCAGDFPVSYNGSSFTEAGTYQVVFQRQGLCDSVVTLALHQAQEHLFVENDTVCDHNLPYLWRGLTLSQSGVYFDSLTTQHGCDSVYRLDLTVIGTQLVVSDPIVLCQGETETWRGMTLSETGTYRDTVAAPGSGCYEIHEVTVVVNPSYLFLDTVTLCSDELPYLWHGMTISEAGTREDFHQTAGTFCDSVYRLTLFVNPSYHVTETASACDYDLPYLWHGQSLGASGVYHDTLVTASGCDSTFALTFTVNASQHEILADTVCQNALPYLWRGHQIIAAGSYADTIPNPAGCLDIFELHLSVLQTDVTTIFDTVCAGSLYDLHGFDTLALLPGTLYDQITLANADGCDSVVNLVLAVLPNYLFEEDAHTCENVPFLWRGNELLVEGTYYDSLLTASGCDSVFVLHLALDPTYEVFVSDSAMREHEYSYDNFVITPADSGTFFYDIQYYTLAGCDSVVHLTLYVAFNDGVEHFSFEPDFSFFPNPTQAMLNIKGQEMKRVDVFNLNGKLVLSLLPDSPEFTQLDVARFATGHYLVKVLLFDGRTVTGKIIVNRY